jgi:hypothetical protein
MPRQFNSSLEAVEAALNEWNRRDAQPYDGIVGLLPTWMPRNFHGEFDFLQVKLLTNLKHSEDEIRRWIATYERESSFIDMTSGLDAIPIRLLDDIGLLAKFKAAAEAGPEEGLKILLDERVAKDIIIGSKTARVQSARARKKRGVLDNGETISQVINRVQDKYPEFYAKEIWEHFGAELDVMGLNPEEVVNPSDSSKKSYRYDFRDQRKSISFGRFEALISGFRSK